MSGSLPIRGQAPPLSPPGTGAASGSVRLPGQGLLSEPKVAHAEAEAIPPALRGAQRSTGPVLKRLDWAATLAVEGGRNSPGVQLLRQAKSGELPRLPLGRDTLTGFAGRAAKADRSFLGLFTIRRDSRYKAVLNSADTLKALYAQPPAQSADALRQQLSGIREALDTFAANIDRYRQSASTARREKMNALAQRVNFEQKMIGAIEASLTDARSAEARPGSLATIGQLFDYTRAGLDLDTADEAVRRGIGHSLAGDAAQVERAVNRLPLDMLAMLARYPDSQSNDPVDDIEALGALHRRGYSSDEIENALALGDPIDQLRHETPEARTQRSERRAYLQALIDVEHPGQAAHQIDDDQRAWLNSDARAFFARKIPIDWVSPCRRADFDANEARNLHVAGATTAQIEAAARGSLSSGGLLYALGEQLPIDEFAYVLKEQQSYEAARDTVMQLPDDAALGWLRDDPASGRRLLRAEASALRAAGVADAGLPLADLVALLDAGVSVQKVASITRSPPDLATVQKILELPTAAPPFSRTEAVLLAGAGWGATRSTVEVFRSRYITGDLIVPINEQTVGRDLAGHLDVIGKKTLGNGVFNTVSAVQYRDAATGTEWQGVFKPLQRPDETSSYSKAAQDIGIALGAPRYELRNLAHARIDQVLGFGVVPRCELAVVNGEPGLLMERVFGAEAAQRAQWNPPIDITNTPLGRECLVFAKNRKNLKLFADLHKVTVTLGGTSKNRQILMSESQRFTRAMDPKQGDWQRSLIGLQYLHALTGAADGHDQNIMRTDDGRHFVGIDNDVSFGARIRDPKQLVQKPNDKATIAFRGKGLPPVVDRAQYQALMALDASTLKQSIGGLISPKEFEATMDRLEVIKDHLRDLKAEQAVIEPDQWGEASFRVIEKHKDQSYAGRLLERRARLPVDPPG